MNKKEINNIIERSCAIIAAITLLQTLFFKFTGSDVSVFIFNELNIEPWGRISSGIIELIAGVLLVFRRSAIWGALLGFFVMTGALLSHLLILGIEINGDSGFLFLLANMVFICCFMVIYFRCNELAIFLKKL